jgi:hypothetical protein
MKRRKRARTEDTVGTEQLKTSYNVCGCYSFEVNGIGTSFWGAATLHIHPAPKGLR